MPGTFLPAAVTCALITIAVCQGCQKRMAVGGIGGNTVRVVYPDGTEDMVIFDEVEEARARWKKLHPNWRPE